MLNAIFSKHMVREKEKKKKNKTKKHTPESSWFFATLQENVSYMENLFILLEFASAYNHLTDITKNLQIIFFLPNNWQP